MFNRVKNSPLPLPRGNLACMSKAQVIMLLNVECFVNKRDLRNEIYVRDVKFLKKTLGVKLGHKKVVHIFQFFL